MTAAERDRIRGKLESVGATALWFYAPGYVCGTDTGVEHVAALTGIQLRKRADIRDYIHLDIDRFDHPLTRGLEHVPDFGSDVPYEFFQEKQEWLQWRLKERDDYKMAPHFSVDDPEAECLATVRATREPGLAIKQVGVMTIVYSAAPLPTPEFFQNLFRHAGAHVYSDTQDIVYANARYVTLCANGEGQKTLRLPRKADLYDAYEDKLLAQDVDEYTFEAKHAQVEIFRLGDRRGPR